MWSAAGQPNEKCKYRDRICILCSQCSRMCLRLLALAERSDVFTDVSCTILMAVGKLKRKRKYPDKLANGATSPR